MSYTRYNLNKKNRMPTILIFTLLIFFLTVTLSLAYKINFNKPKESSVSNVKNQDTQLTVEFVSLQLGKYEVLENADKIYKFGQDYGIPFKVSEDKCTRVFLGIYNKDDVDSKCQNLKSKGVETSSVSYKIEPKSFEEGEAGQCVKALIVVVNNLEDKSIKSINTSKLKEWSSSLKKENKSVKLEKIQDYIKKLPNYITIKEAEGVYNFLYAYLKEYIVKWYLSDC